MINNVISHHYKINPGEFPITNDEKGISMGFLLEGY